MVKKRVTEMPAIVSWDMADSVLGEIRALESQAAALEADKDQRLQAIKDRFDPDIKDRLARAALLAKGLKEFADVHRGDFGDAKSRKLSSGVVGYRNGNPEIATVGKYTWAKALTCMCPPETFERIVQFVIRVTPWGKFLRVKLDINKQALLDAKLAPEKLRTVGMRVDQDERFYYEASGEPAANTGAA